MKNEEYLNYLIKEYPNLQELTCNYNELHYKNEVCLLTKLKLHDFINNNTMLIRKLSSLKAKSFFEIIKCHVLFIELKSKNQYLNNLNDIGIQDIRIIKRPDKDGFIKNYLYYIDKNGESKLIENNNSNDILEIYNQLLATNYGTINARDIKKQIESYQVERTIDQEEPLHIDLKDYQNYLTKDNLTKEELEKIKNFENYIFMLYKYRQFLHLEISNYLNQYLEYIEKIKLKDNPSIEQLNAVQRFENYTKDLEEKNLYLSEEKIRSLKKTNPTYNAGYFNGFILIGLVILLGLIIGVRLVNKGMSLNEKNIVNYNVFNIYKWM